MSKIRHFESVGVFFPINFPYLVAYDLFKKGLYNSNPSSSTHQQNQRVIFAHYIHILSFQRGLQSVILAFNVPIKALKICKKKQNGREGR